MVLRLKGSQFDRQFDLTFKGTIWNIFTELNRKGNMLSWNTAFSDNNATATMFSGVERVLACVILHTAHFDVPGFKDFCAKVCI